MYAMIHPSLFNTECNGMRQISKTTGVREPWIFIIKSIHWCATVPTTFAIVLKRRVPNDLKSKQKTWERPPIKRWESGLLRLYIAPVSAYLRWYDITIHTEDKNERVNTQEPKRLQFEWWIYDTMTTTKITQGTADGDQNVVARILAWQYAEDIDRLARTQDMHSFWLR